jgi:phosphatidate cytidylyltransferase
LVSAAILISALALLLALDYRQFGTGMPGVWLLPVAALFLGLATQELLDLFRPLSHFPSSLTVHAGVQGVALSAAGPALLKLGGATCPLGTAGWPMLAMAMAVGLVFVVEMARYREPGGTTQRVALSVFAIAYLGLLGSFLVALRLVNGNQWGMAALVSTILIAKMTDTGAYFTGRLLGRRPMAPRLSPKKTIEGAVGGIVAAVTASGLFFIVLLPRWFVDDPAPLAAWRWIAHGLLIAVASMLGDLAESLLKRDLGSKDASQRLPGMGGVLDVLDSLLLVAPVAYASWIAGLVAP